MNGQGGNRSRVVLGFYGSPDDRGEPETLNPRT
jgi:hypothetical protein